MQDCFEHNGKKDAEDFDINAFSKKFIIDPISLPTGYNLIKVLTEGSSIARFEPALGFRGIDVGCARKPIKYVNRRNLQN